MTEGRMSQENASFFLGCLLLPPRWRQCRLPTRRAIVAGCSDMSWLPGPTSLHHNGLYQDPQYQLASASLIGNGIMKAKSVYNNMKQQSRSCGIEDNASFAPTNGRDRTDRQDRQTYRHRTKQPRTMYCLCLLLLESQYYMHTLAIKIMHFIMGTNVFMMDRLKYVPHTSQVPSILRYQIYTLDSSAQKTK